MGRSGKKFWPLWVYTLRILAGATVAWLGVEVLVHFLAARLIDVHPIVISNPLIGWRLEPDLLGVRERSKEFQYTVYTDDHGFRIGSIDTQHPDHCDVLFLGDSFLFGVGVDEEQSLVGRLRPNAPNWVICNAGVPGYGTDQELLTLSALYTRRFLHPGSVVVLLTFINDFTDILRRTEWGRGKPWYTSGTNGALELHEPARLPQLLWNHSAILYWSDFTLHQKGLIEDKIYGDMSTTPALYLRLLAAISSLTRSNGWKLALAYTSGKMAGTPGAVRCNLLAQGYAERNHLSFASLDDCMPNLPSYYYVADSHWNETGNAVAYQCLNTSLFHPLGITQ